MADTVNRPVAETVGWLCTGGVGTMLITQLFGWDGSTVVAVLQALMPIGLAAMLVVTAAAAVIGFRHLTIVSALVLIGLIALAAPLVFHGGHRSPADGTRGVSIASVNLLFDNREVLDVADDLLRRSPDVIAFSEYVPAHRRMLTSHPLADRYPYRIDLDESFGSGMALWSAMPIVDRGAAILRNRGIDATVGGPDGPIRIIAVHPRTPISDFDLWRDALADVGNRASPARGTGAAPTVVVGDLNASYWHPAFRRLLRDGLTDAHIASGDGWSTSWPINRLIPAFVRLDHALTDDRLAVTDLVDFEPPGSDHRAFVVTVAPTELSRVG